MAALRNLAITALRPASVTNIAATRPDAFRPLVTHRSRSDFAGALLTHLL
jgi:hypothetical protein